MNEIPFRWYVTYLLFHGWACIFLLGMNEYLLAGFAAGHFGYALSKVAPSNQRPESQ